MSFIFAIAVYINFSQSIQLLSEEIVTKEMDLVILLDVSGTMNTYDSEKEAIQWSKDIVMLCYNMNINLSLIAFKGNIDDEPYYVIIENEKITDENYGDIADKINAVDYTGNATNQNTALVKAEKILNNSKSDVKCIIILSDGELDIVYPKNDTDKNNLNAQAEAEKKDEEKEKDSFIVNCRDITTDDSYRIYLIHIDKNIGFFNEVKNEYINNVFYYIMERDGVEYDESDDLIDFDGLTKIIFNELEMPIVMLENSFISENKIIFNTDEDYYRSIITVISDDSKMLSDIISSISIKKDGNEWTSYDTKSSGSLLYIYINNPSSGEYTVEFPENTSYEYSICHIYNYKDIKPLIKLMLKNGDAQIEFSNNTLDGIKAYQIEQFTDYNNMELQVTIPYYKNLDEIDCFYKKSNDENEKSFTLKVGKKDDVTGDKKFNKDLKNCFTEIGQYTVYASFSSYISDSIIIEIHETTPAPTPSPTPIWINDVTLYIDQKKDLKTIIKDHIDEVNLLKDVKIEKNIDDNLSEIEYDGSGILCFSETGKYICTVEINGEEIKIIKFNIFVDKCNFVPSFIKVVIVFVSVFVFVFVKKFSAYKKRKKQKNKP